MAGTSGEELPAELEEQCDECHQSLVGIERLLKSLFSVSRAQMEEKVRIIIDCVVLILFSLTPAVGSVGCGI
jgi:hypothetical protein